MECSCNIQRCVQRRNQSRIPENCTGQTPAIFSKGQQLVIFRSPMKWIEKPHFHNSISFSPTVGVLLHCCFQQHVVRQQY